VLSTGGWDTHSSAWGLQTQQHLFEPMISNTNKTLILCYKTKK
jgi:hypothetical protein